MYLGEKLLSTRFK